MTTLGRDYRDVKIDTIIIAILIIGLTTAANADELAEREVVRAESAKLFRASNFSGLERVASDFRQNKSRTSSGTWKLSEFYKGIAWNGPNFERILDEDWETSANKFDQWIEDFPNSPTPYIAKGTALMARGWAFRGWSSARDVEKSAMEAFQQFAVLAAKVLIEKGETASNDPHWYSTLANVFKALGVPKQDFLSMVYEGIEKFPDYDQLYFETAGYLSAKWYGSDEELDAFAQRAVAKTAEGRGQELYARIYWAAGMRNRSEYAFQSPNANWYYMEKGMDAVIEKYPTQWNINHFAYFSCYFWHEDAARKYLAMIEQPILSEVWNPSVNYTRCNNRLDTLDRLRGEAKNIEH